MLMRTDPCHPLDRFTQALLGVSGTWSRPSPIPMDAYRAGEEFVITLDLPGVSPDAIDIDVRRNVLTVKAERRPTAETDDVQMHLSERPLGAFSRQIVLGDTLDTEHITASYDAGVLTLRIPVTERTESRRITIDGGAGQRQPTD
ncbi:Hsp20/alpha crystallin family protein [Streptomyces sp. NRRL S-1448]|uniref:Hsp20/alpha crystallin family protein n=1 Tax=Streptomyces sp. NRRL S-1448 TaxID=1463883 RepID=UPI0004BE7BA9|nr:Hsp20/alpha crystallin family protein [Streptomyces sp. NRRL S-1448]